MDPDEARAHLGLPRDATPDDLRSAFRRLVRQHHPDVTGGDGATARLLTEAYRTLLAAAHASDDDHDHAPTVTTDDDSITLALPPDEAFVALLDAAARIGTVTSIDHESHLLDVRVTFDDGRTTNALVSLQGRAATGTTDAFVTLDEPDLLPVVVAALAEATTP